MPGADTMIEEEQRYRASAYSLLAALLRCAPDPALLLQLGSLLPDGDASQDALCEAMAGLAASATHDPAQLEDEYHSLFIGIGRGEVVPYGSWYLTGFLMEQPLSDLRDDLMALGFEKSADMREPEDHVSAIFEVFSVMVSSSFSHAEQQRFFETHMLPWVGRFFIDLGDAQSAVFYQDVARFGAAFIELEKTYISMQS